MNLHNNNTEKNMQDIIIYVTLIGMEDELDVDIAGFDCVQDLEDFITEQVEEFNENNPENEAQVKGWKVTDVNNCGSEVSWMLAESLDPGNWEWEWIEHMGSNNMTHDVAVCESAFQLDITVDNYEEAYQGHFSSAEHFAQETAEAIGAIPDGLGWPCSCIDWDHAASELMQDYCEEDDYYFRIM